MLPISKQDPKKTRSKGPGFIIHARGHSHVGLIAAFLIQTVPLAL